MLRFLFRIIVHAGFFGEEPIVHHSQVLYVNTCKGSEWSDQVSNLRKEVNEAKPVGVFYPNLSKIFDRMLYMIQGRKNQELGINDITSLNRR